MKTKEFIKLALIVNTIAIVIGVGLGINDWLKHKGIITPNAKTSFETPLPQVEKKDDIKYSFYHELPLQKVMVDAKPLIPDHLKEEPVLLIRGKVAELKGNLRCLAVNIYFEARDRSQLFQEAVGFSTMQRVGRYGNKSICDAVTNHRIDPQNGLMVKDKCHYSWYCDDRTVLEVAENPVEDVAYQKAVDTALKVIAMTAHNRTHPLGLVSHYHRVDKNPSWNKDMIVVMSIADHIFYKGH